MRLYNKYYRCKNPSGVLSGDRKSVYEALVKLSAKRNPDRGKVTVWNLLGEVNKYIDEGGADYLIPIRDILTAKAEGFIDVETLKYNLHDAIRNLGSAEARAVKRIVETVGASTSAHARADISKAVERDPEVIDARKHVRAAEEYNRAFIAAMRRGDLSQEEWSSGAAVDRGKVARSTYAPKNIELWKSVVDNLKKKYPHRAFGDIHYVPSNVRSVMRDEFALLVELAHAGASVVKKSRIRQRLQTALRNRWKTAIILAYENAGGTELSEEQKKLRRLQKERAYDIPFPIGEGLYGVVRVVENGIRWFIVGQDSTIYMSNVEHSKNSASRAITVAGRIINNLMSAKRDVGWDNLPVEDTRWLAEKKPHINKSIATILASNIGVNRKVNKDTMKWILAAGEIGKIQASAREAVSEDIGSICSAMEVGQKRAFRVPGKRYSIHVEKTSGDTPYRYFVEAASGAKSMLMRASDCDFLARAHVIGDKLSRGKIAMGNPKRSSGASTGKCSKIPGVNRKYVIVYTKGTGKSPHKCWVETTGGKKSSVYKAASRADAIRTGHVVAGAILGATQVAGAASNPSKMRRLKDSATRGIRKTNPSAPRVAAEVGDIKDLSGIIGIPSDSKDAFRYGFYIGIIRGIDTCGVQNYFKRRKIRKDFQKKLYQAQLDMTARLTGTAVPKTPHVVTDSGYSGLNIDLDDLDPSNWYGGID